MSDSIATVMFTYGRGVNRLSLALFRLNAHNQQIVINANVPNRIINFLQLWLNLSVHLVGTQHITKALCDVLELAYHVIQNRNANIQNMKFLAVIIIDGTLSLGDNSLTVSDQFNRRDISLAVVAAATPVFEVWDHYRTLARYASGAYMLLENAPATLERVILSVINGEFTLRQAFYHVGTENAVARANDIDGMNEQNQIVDGDGDFEFNHGL